jgi:hypothetical protein
MATSDSTDDSEFFDHLRQLDPTTADQSPAHGSSRYNSIMENAMQNTMQGTDLPRPEATQQPAPSSKRPRWLLVGAAAALIVAVAGVLTIQLVRAPSAEATVSSATANLEEIKSLEAELTATGNGNTTTGSLKAADGDFVLAGQTHYADGHSESSMFTVVDGIGYETIDGQTTKSPVTPQQLPAPFASSSAAVISAALKGSDVVERGEDQIGDATATRYDIDLSSQAVDALSDLTPNQLGWFELEYPEQTRRLSLWIADDVIRQIEIDNDGVITRSRYFDLNGDITVEPPPGPYTEPGE